MSRGQASLVGGDRTPLVLACCAVLLSCQYISGIVSFTESEGSGGGTDVGGFGGIGGIGAGGNGAGGSGAGGSGAGGMGATGATGGTGGIGAGGTGGATPIEFPCGDAGAKEIALDPAALYAVVGDAPAEIVCCPLNGDAPLVLDQAAAPRSLALVGGKLFFMELGAPSTLRVLDAGASSAAVEVPSMSGLSAIAAGNTRLYVARSNAIYELDPANPLEPAPALVSSTVGTVTALAAVDASRGVFISNGEVYRFGGGSTWIAVGGKGGAADVAANPIQSFASDYGGLVHERPFEGGPASSIVDLALGQQPATRLRVHPAEPQRLYFTTTTKEIAAWSPSGVDTLVASTPAPIDDLEVGTSDLFFVRSSVIHRLALP